VVRAQQLWFAVLEAQIETGNPYMLYKDSCNRKSNQQNLGTIKCSNLCTGGWLEAGRETTRDFRHTALVQKENMCDCRSCDVPTGWKQRQRRAGTAGHVITGGVRDIACWLPAGMAQPKADRGALKKVQSMLSALLLGC
jgi:hypothetical protein